MTNNQEAVQDAKGELSDRKFVIRYVPTHSACLLVSFLQRDFSLGVGCFAYNTFHVRQVFDARLTKSMFSIKKASSFEWVNVRCKVTQMLSLSLNNLMCGSVAMYATTTSQDQYRMELEIAHPFKFCKPLNSSDFNCLFLIPLKLFQAS
jgi:hypothetical protein